MRSSVESMRMAFTEKSVMFVGMVGVEWCAALGGSRANKLLGASVANINRLQSGGCANN